MHPIRVVPGLRRSLSRLRHAARHLRRRLAERAIGQWVLLAHLAVSACALGGELPTEAAIVSGSIVGLALLEHLRGRARSWAAARTRADANAPGAPSAPSPSVAATVSSVRGPSGGDRIRERLSRLAEDRISSVEPTPATPPPDVGSHGYALRESLDEVVRWMSPRALRKRTRLSVLVGRGVPDDLVGDPEALQEVVGRLVHHAIGYTELGRVTVHVDVAWQSQDHVMLDFAVTDDGAGIPLREQCRIMGLVARVDEPTEEEARDPDSLALCAALVRKRGGTMEIDSDPGEGTTYRFTMCAGIRAARPRVAQVKPEPAVEDLLDNLSVLVVDGISDRRNAIRELCESWNMRPTAIPKDAEMHMLLEAAQNVGQPFDLVLLAEPSRDPAVVAAEIQRDFSSSHPGVVSIAHLDEGDLRRRLQRAAAAARAVRTARTSSGPLERRVPRTSHAA